MAGWRNTQPGDSRGTAAFRTDLADAAANAGRNRTDAGTIGWDCLWRWARLFHGFAHRLRSGAGAGFWRGSAGNRYMHIGSIGGSSGGQ